MIRTQVSCIPIKGKKIAVIRKDKPISSTHQKWIPAGGHVEQGETLREACIRELKEETGIDVTNPRVGGIVTFINDFGYHSVCTFFTDNDPSGDIEITEDNIDVEWFEIDELLKCEDVTFYHKVIYSKLLVEKKHFNITLKFEGESPIPKLYNE